MFRELSVERFSRSIYWDVLIYIEWVLIFLLQKDQNSGQKNYYFGGFSWVEAEKLLFNIMVNIPQFLSYGQPAPKSSGQPVQSTLPALQGLNCPGSNYSCHMLPCNLNFWKYLKYFVLSLNISWQYLSKKKNLDIYSC